ncbi:hypothetical protein HYFRA_00011307 [Hymenoscyphus fraxineus]|uniref:Uncharacterized protein n=1 Tax=Hymenoscyphus fraxineus TaxID=746836 RepID=A0A9N9PJ37_9HELO|nr:hypothetical protein HYFRA_00011307 [Hymenoscyphus fraxineus]
MAITKMPIKPVVHCILAFRDMEGGNENRPRNEEGLISVRWRNDNLPSNIQKELGPGDSMNKESTLKSEGSEQDNHSPNHMRRRKTS